MTTISSYIGALFTSLFADPKQVEKQEAMGQLNDRMKTLQRHINTFSCCIRYPEEPLEDPLSETGKKLYGTSIDKQNYFWTYIESCFTEQGKFDVHMTDRQLNTDPDIIQKRQHLSACEDRLILLRRESYRVYVKGLGGPELLAEARERLIMAYTRMGIEAPTPDNAISALQAIRPQEGLYYYNMVEIEEILAISDALVRR